jgi:hypothetical protein
MTIEATETDDPGRRGAPVMLPATDCDALFGLEQIAAWFGCTTGCARSRIDRGLIVAHHIKGRSGVVALKSENNEHLRKLIAERGRSAAKPIKRPTSRRDIQQRGQPLPALQGIDQEPHSSLSPSKPHPALP